MQETPTSQQPIPQEHTVYPPPQYTVYPPQPAIYPPPPMYQPPQKPPPPSNKRLWMIIGIVVAALLVLGLINSIITGTLRQTTTTPSIVQPTQQVTTQPTQPPATQPTQEITPEPTSIPTIPPTPTPEPTLTTEQQVLQIAQNSGALGSNITVKYYASSNSAKITETIESAWSKASAKRYIQDDCYHFQKAVWTSHIKVSSIDVNVLGPLVDKYGKQSIGLVGSCTLLDTTAQKINWSNMDYRTAWENQIYDYQWLLPDLNS